MKTKEPKRLLCIDELVCVSDLKMFKYDKIMTCGNEDIYGCQDHRVALTPIPEYKGVYKVSRTYHTKLIK